MANQLDGGALRPSRAGSVGQLSFGQTSYVVAAAGTSHLVPSSGIYAKVRMCQFDRSFEIHRGLTVMEIARPF